MGASQNNEINFAEHISPIIYNNCTECHRPGESGPMSFTSYGEVAAMAEMIKEVTQTGYMPPWPPNENYTPHSLLDERFLTDEEKELIAQWVDQGYPQGDISLEAEIPFFPEGSAVGEPDYVFEMSEEYFIAGNEVHLFEAYADSDGWERHVDRFLENYANEFLTIFEPNQMFAYGPVSQKLKEKIKDFGFTYFDKLGGV